MNTIPLGAHRSAVPIRCNDDFARAHIMVSSPALPGLGNVVWMYVQNVIAIDHQSFRIIIGERLMIVRGGI